MALSLNELQDAPQTSIEDLKTPASVGPQQVVSPATNKTHAAKAALFNHDPKSLLDEYEKIVSSLNDGQHPDEVHTSMDDARDQEKKDAKESLNNILVDPNIPDSDKKGAIYTVFHNNSDMYSPTSMLSSLALQKAAAHDNPEGTRVRYSIAATHAEYSKVQEIKQSLYNKFILDHKASFGGEAVNVVKMIVPGLYQAQGSKIAGKVLGDEPWYKDLEHFVFPSTVMSDIKEKMKNASPAEQIQLTQHILDAVGDNPGLILPGNNAVALQYANNFLNPDAYTTGDAWLDNITSLADGLTGVLSLVKLGKIAKIDKAVDTTKSAIRGIGTSADRTSLVGRKTVKASKEAGAVLLQIGDNLERDMFKGVMQPSSVASQVSGLNPWMYRNIFKVADEDSTGEAAQALFGVDRDTAITDSVLPEVGHSDGSVRVKVSEPTYSPDNELDDNIVDLLTDDGYSALAREEKEKTRSLKVNQFQGAVARDNMFHVHSFESNNAPDGVRITAMYGPPNSGFSDPEEAINSFLYSTRDLGLDRSNITLYQRVGDEYVPMTTGDLGYEEPIVSSKGKSTPSIKDTKETNEGEALKPKSNKLKQKRDAKGRFLPKVKDYLIGVDYKYRFSPGDVEDWFKTNTRWALFNRAKGITEGTAGSLNAHLFPNTSVLHKVILVPALSLTDRASELERRLLKSGLSQFVGAFKKTDRELQGKIYSWIKKANNEGFEPSDMQLIADGFTNAGLDAMHHWRKLWDNIWHLNNADFAKTLINRGYSKFVDNVGDSYLFAKGIKNRGRIKGPISYLDTETGEVKDLTRKEIDELYEKGGVVARLKDKVPADGDWAEYIISPETPDQYLRKINFNDHILSYRKGFYHREYKGPYFIDRVWKDKRGVDAATQTVGTAKTQKEADELAARLDKKSEDGSTHKVRLDRKIDQGDLGFDTRWDLYNSSGLGSQRFRGKMLVSATGPEPEFAHIVDPLESAIKSIRTIATRTVMRDYLDTLKSRFLNSYHGYLPTNDFKDSVFPTTRSEIFPRKGIKNSNGIMKNARTEFDFIRYMEDGYVNAIDDFHKNAFNAIADLFGNVHLGTLETGARRIANISLTGDVKKVTFGLYLALNPVRQALVQSHQAIFLAAHSPLWFTTHALPQMTYMIARQMGLKAETLPEEVFHALGMTRNEADIMFDHWMKTGLAASVDKQNIVRGSLNDIADSLYAQSKTGKLRKTLAPIKGVMHLSRKVGFDAGEYVNILSAWLAERNRAVKAGKDIMDANVRDEVSALARNFTGSMNAAGDMPWNRNWLAMVLQFQQQGYKMLHLMTTNRMLSTWDKAKLAALTTTMWGIPSGGGAWILKELLGDDTPDEALKDQKLVEYLDRGLEAYLLNKVATMVFPNQGKTDVDFSNLNPLNIYGTGKLIHSIFTGNWAQTLTSIPAGSLLFGGNARLTEFAKTTAGVFHFNDKDPYTWAREAKAFANLSSGLSSAFQAAHQLKYHQALSTWTGRVTDPDVNAPEAVARFFGLHTYDSVQKATQSQELYQKTLDYDKDVSQMYKNYKDVWAPAIAGQTPLEDALWATKVYNQAWATFGNSPRAMRIIDRELKKDAAKGDYTMYSAALKAAGIFDEGEWKVWVLNNPRLTDDTKKKLLKFGYNWFEQKAEIQQAAKERIEENQ